MLTGETYYALSPIPETSGAWQPWWQTTSPTPTVVVPQASSLTTMLYCVDRWNIRCFESDSRHKWCLATPDGWQRHKLPQLWSHKLTVWPSCCTVLTGGMYTVPSLIPDTSGAWQPLMADTADCVNFLSAHSEWSVRGKVKNQDQKLNKFVAWCLNQDLLNFYQWYKNLLGHLHNADQSKWVSCHELK